MSTGAGIALILAGGVSAGLFTAPMKYTSKRGWEHENVWLVYAIYGMAFFPWMLVFFSVPDPFDVYSSADPMAIVYACVCGFLWGVGSTTFGIGVDAVGSALGFALILGMTSAIGAALPLVVLHTSEAGRKEGIYTWAGLGVVAVGLFILAVAGRKKERDQAHVAGEISASGSSDLNSKDDDYAYPISSDAMWDKYQTKASTSSELDPLLAAGINTSAHTNGKTDRAITTDDASQTQTGRPSFVVGLVFCLVSGLLSPMLNLAIAFGSDIADQAKDRGASAATSNNAIWALAVSCGFIPNGIYSLIMMKRKKIVYKMLNPPGQTSSQPLINALLAALCGIFWFGGNVLYGIGEQWMGDLGTVLGWPMFMCTMVITGNVLGFSTGEWKNTRIRTKFVAFLGLFFLFGAVVIISIGSA